jgi:nicotinamidase/pyrazinamidase
MAIDVQADLLPSGRLPVPGMAAVVKRLNRYLGVFAAKALPVLATRRWHPIDHCSFTPQGGVWPAHCIQATPGAALIADLRCPKGTRVVAHGSDPSRDAHSAFAGTGLEALLRSLGVRRLFVGGALADYGVLQTVQDALALGFEVVVLEDALAARDGGRAGSPEAVMTMRHSGARSIRFEHLAVGGPTSTGGGAPGQLPAKPS